MVLLLDGLVRAYRLAAPARVSFPASGCLWLPFLFRLVALLLAWFLGVFGAHRFYVGKTGTAVAMIFTIGGLGVWALIDFIMIAAGSFTDIDGHPVTVWDTAN